MISDSWLKARFRLDALILKYKLKSIPRSVINPERLIEYQQSLLSQFSKSINEAQLMAIDLEMTGLNPTEDQIISMGIVPITQAGIPLQQAQHLMISIDGSVGSSATIHGIVDNQLENALSLEQAVLWFLEHTKGHILVAHHAPMDVSFLLNYIEKVFGFRMLMPFIDTLGIEKKRYLRQHGQLIKGCVRLGESRERYHLPVYAGHNALLDAIACAELLLAQVAAMGGGHQMKCYELIETIK
ncbi:exonuclease domain-containing protein [Shewanella gaetbuli]|uniref:3'-5' exonuclease n=1 Tax=Shewanella gaetbuli TaxID=220752 RepID=A0A9X1ZWS1_9GAMM|nr:3'-5' exonuclease [Shewanella gaetbuli]